MKIYFAGSIKGGRDNQKQYFEIIKYLKKYGVVLTEHIGNYETNIKNEIRLSNKEDEHVYLRDKNWLDESDIIIAEVSIPSLGVGYEIGYALANNKKVICLYNENSEKELSYMISGNRNNIVIRYNELDEVYNKLDKILK